MLLALRPMDSDLEMQLPSLLLWLDEQGRERPGEYVDVSAYAGNEPGAMEFVGMLITILEDRGYVDVVRGLDDRPDSLITKRGKVEAQRVRETRGNRVARMRFARDAVIQWLFVEYPTHAGSQQQFLGWKGSVFLGDMLTNDEFSEAVRYLRGRDLVEVTNLAGTDVRLTTNGIDCATSGGSVSDFLNGPKPQSAGGPVFNAPINGPVAVNSSQFTQNVVTSGAVDIEGLRAFASLVRELTPSLTPHESEQQELLSEVSELDIAASTAVPDASLLKRLTGRVVTAVKGLTHSPGVQKLALEAGEKVLDHFS